MSTCAAENLGFLPDIQSRADTRALPIDAVGVRGVRYPLTVSSGGLAVPTVGTWTMTVALPAAAKGTHMSRFIELLETRTDPLEQRACRALLRRMLERLGAASGALEVAFPWFVTKTAPVSGVSSRLDCQVRWHAHLSPAGQYAFRMRVGVPATSLCPCSKEISAYGAHNQRSLITIDAELAGQLAIEELIALAEASASCEVYGLLKRADEKYVTERAYDNPRFVEDLVREVALALNREPRVRGYMVEAENFESIHNHSAVARIVHAAGGAAATAPAASENAT